MGTYTNRKCLVEQCPNHSDEGEFLGPVCSPCAKALKGEPSPAASKRIVLSVMAYAWPTN